MLIPYKLSNKLGTILRFEINNSQVSPDFSVYLSCLNFIKKPKQLIKEILYISNVGNENFLFHESLFAQSFQSCVYLNSTGIFLEFVTLDSIRITKYNLLE